MRVVVGMEPEGTLWAAGTSLSVDPGADYTGEFGL